MLVQARALQVWVLAQRLPPLLLATAAPDEVQSPRAQSEPEPLRCMCFEMSSYGRTLQSVENDSTQCPPLAPCRPWQVT